MYFSWVYFESTGIQGEGAYRKLCIITFKNTGLFSCQAKSYFCRDKQIHLENGVLQIHFCCFTLLSAEKASSVIVYLASW